MGWWQTDDGLLVGDGPLDAVGDFLHEIAKEYRRDHKRKPSLDEVFACLTAVLRAQAEEFVDGCDDLEIIAVEAKARKRPKKQKYRPGDVFSIPLGNGQFGFGRVTPQSSLYEFFELVSDNVVPVSQLSQVTTFRIRKGVSDESLKDWTWKVIGHLPYKSGEFKVQPFLMGHQIWVGEKPGPDGFIDPSSKIRMATDTELRTLPPYLLTGPDTVVDGIKKRLQKT